MQPAAYLAVTKFLAGKADFVAFIDLDKFLVAAPDLPSQVADTPAEVGAIGCLPDGLRLQRAGALRAHLVISRFTARAQERAVKINRAAGMDRRLHLLA